MSFKDEERRLWHAQKAKQEYKPHAPFRAQPVTTCIHCGQAFGHGEGVITDEVSLCSVCD
jgi:hypothetical protein